MSHLVFWDNNKRSNTADTFSAAFLEEMTSRSLATIYSEDEVPRPFDEESDWDEEEEAPHSFLDVDYPAGETFDEEFIEVQPTHDTSFVTIDMFDGEVEVRKEEISGSLQISDGAGIVTVMPHLPFQQSKEVKPKRKKRLAIFAICIFVGALAVVAIGAAVAASGATQGGEQNRSTSSASGINSSSGEGGQNAGVGGSNANNQDEQNNQNDQNQDDQGDQDNPGNQLDESGVSEPSSAPTASTPTATPSASPSIPAPSSNPSSIPTDSCQHNVYTDSSCYLWRTDSILVEMMNCKPRADDWIGIYLDGADPNALGEDYVSTIRFDHYYPSTIQTETQAHYYFMSSSPTHSTALLGMGMRGSILPEGDS
jgi:hypothetical protein